MSSRRLSLGSALRIKREEPESITPKRENINESGTPLTVLSGKHRSSPGSALRIKTSIKFDSKGKTHEYSSKISESDIAPRQLYKDTSSKWPQSKVTSPSSSSSSASTASSSPFSSLPSSNKCKIWNIDHFSFGRAIGRGKFGNVYYAVHKSAQEHSVAVKVGSKSRATNGMMQEIKCHEMLSPHPNIVKICGSFEDSRHVYIVLEWICGGDLFRLLQTKRDGTGKLPEATCREYLQSLASAVYHMHSHAIIHRDLKPENILVSIDAGIVLKVADFGCAVQRESKKKKQYTLCGTSNYVSPEMIHRSGHDEAVDMWAIGILLFEMLFGRTPFADLQATQQTNQRTQQRILRYDGDIRKLLSTEDKSHCSLLVLRLFGDLLQPNLKLRLTASEFIDCKWLAANEAI